MLPIPKTTFTRYLTFLSSTGISGKLHPEYVKWLRYYLDFCAKYVITDLKSERLKQFLAKLREKNQGEQQRTRAAHAVSLYFEMQDHNEPRNISPRKRLLFPRWKILPVKCRQPQSR